MGNAGDIVPVRVNMHLLAWPHDLGNLSDYSHEHFLLFVGTKPPCPVLVWNKWGGPERACISNFTALYNSPTYCSHMLNPSIQDGWEDCTLVRKSSSSGKCSNHHR